MDKWRILRDTDIKSETDHGNRPEDIGKESNNILFHTSTFRLNESLFQAFEVANNS